MSRLWLFGCSHSSPTNTGNNVFWGKILADKLNITFEHTEGSPIINGKRMHAGAVYGDGGSGIDVIMLNAMTKIHLDYIKPEDVVIFNASYSTRVHSTMHVQKPTQDKRWVNWHLSIFEQYFRPNWGLDYKREDLLDMNFKTDRILFAHWYVRQATTYKMLKDTGAEVYQWLLEPKDLIEDILSNIDGQHLDEQILAGQAQIYESLFEYLKDSHDGWENLIECPVIEPPHPTPYSKSVNCWSDVFSEVYPVRYQRDAHMNTEGHYFFAEHLYKSIMEYRNGNK